MRGEEDTVDYPGSSLQFNGHSAHLALIISE
jgi:hypothetical protein